MNGTCLKQIERQLGEEPTMQLIILLIMKNINFFNVGKNLNEDQAIETAMLLLDEYKYETLEDFVMMFKMAKKGLFGNGQIYNRIDGNIILGWMKEYREKKVTERESYYLNRKYEEQQQNQTPLLALAEENEKPFDKDEFYKKGRELDEERKRQEEEKKEKEREERRIRRDLYLKNTILNKEYQEQIIKERQNKQTDETENN